MFFWFFLGLAGMQAGCGLLEYPPFDSLNIGKPKVSDSYLKGVDYYRQGLYKPAVKELETVPPDHPKFKRAQDYLTKASTLVMGATVHINAALRYRREGELFKAKKEFEQALEIYPKYERVHTLLEALDRDIEATVNFYYEKGQEEFEKGNYEDAQTAFREALKADPEESRILTDLSKTNDFLVRTYLKEGIVLYEKGMFDEALKRLEKAYQINSADPPLVNQLTDVYNRRALKYYGEDKLPQAVVDLKRSLEIKPDQREIRSQLERIQKRLGQLEQIGP